MNILHYSLGLPPYRSGGLVKYAMDLMLAQRRQGHNTQLLWPGRIHDFSDRISIKKQNNYLYEEGISLENFELLNPLPVPLLSGITAFKEYMQTKNPIAMRDFLVEENIEIAHIHTLMGLPKEFVELCRELGIKTVFTSHDFFGLCAKWNLHKDGCPCLEDDRCRDCILCNRGAFSLKQVKFLQSPLYRKMKESPILKMARGRYKAAGRQEPEADAVLGDLYSSEEIERLAASYRQLRKYYLSMLESMDSYHFNSSRTLHIYERFLEIGSKGEVINITHDGIKDHRKIRRTGSPVRLGYLGPLNQHKGFYYLVDVCDKLAEKMDFELHIFSEFGEDRSYMVEHSPYPYFELPAVMDSIDLLIAPSIGNETFGFTVQEAMSYGVPSIVTENVGAKDLIENHTTGIVLPPLEKELYDILSKVIEEPEIINRMNKNICKKARITTMEDHEKEIMALYKKI